jgi:hypothetical protein
MDGLAQAIAALKAENKRLEQKLQNVRVATLPLQLCRRLPIASIEWHQGAQE